MARSGRTARPPTNEKAAAWSLDQHSACVSGWQIYPTNGEIPPFAWRS